jgi:hypothetical protein
VPEEVGGTLTPGQRRACAHAVVCDALSLIHFAASYKTGESKCKRKVEIKRYDSTLDHFNDIDHLDTTNYFVHSLVDI